jgi:hypothetical protein
MFREIKNELEAFKAAYFSDKNHTGQLGVYERTKSKLKREQQTEDVISKVTDKVRGRK